MLVAVVAGALGCGDDAAVPPPWTSGARLRAEVIDGGAGAVQFRRWRDSALDVACAFATATDGAVRCLPTEAAYLIYTDAACTERAAVHFTQPGCTSPAYAAEPIGLVCPDEPRAYYPVGASLGDGPVYVARDGACERFVVAPLYAVGPAVDPTQFVAATVHTQDHGDGLAARVAIADDGARQLLSLADRVGAPCSRRELSDGASVCVGAVAFQAAQLHADDACTAPAPAVTDRCQPAPDVVETAGGLALPAGASTAPLYDGAPGSCGLADGYTPWLPGRLATAADFPAAPTTTTGAGALQLRWASDAAGTPLIGETFVDTARGADCLAMTTTGDAGRCVPWTAWAGSSTWYTDAACTTPAWQQQRATAIVVTTTSVCSASHIDRAYAVAPFAGPLYLPSDAGCVLVPDAPTDHVYAATAELPLTDLPAVTFRVE